MSFQTPSSPFPKILVINVIIAVILLAINMRSPIVGFGAIANLAQAELGISAKTIGFIGALPMFAFAISSFLAPKIAKKIGLENTMLLSAFFLTLGIIVRVWRPSEVLLLIGTVLLSLAISLGNVLAPAVIKKYTPQRISLIMGLYTMTLSVFAGIASGVAMPLAQWKNWQFALGIWGIISALAFFAWLGVKLLSKHFLSRQPFTAVSNNSTETIPSNQNIPLENSFQPQHLSVWHIKTAWWISGYIGLQSLLYYTLASFLPSILIDKGLLPDQAGRIGMYFQLMAFPSIMLLSYWVGKGYNLRLLGMTAALGNLIGVIGFGFLSVKLAWLWSITAGFGCGIIFTLSLMVLTLKSRDSLQASDLSGMAQSIGYSIAILGPFGMGWLKDFSGGWQLPWGILILLMVLECICGWFATADKPLQ